MFLYHLNLMALEIGANTVLDPTVWGPHYWFVLHTIALSYPRTPNDVCKKKYYNFIQNLPILLPVEEIGNNFSKFLDKYPVTPYLDSRESFIRWVHFIHNKVNCLLNLPQLTLSDAMTKYYKEYIPKNEQNLEDKKFREKIIFTTSVVILLSISVFFYVK